MSRRHSIEFTPEGLEILDSRPIELPLGFERPLSLQEEIRRMIALETSRAAADAGLESFEEADDFEVDEDADEFVSPYEVLEMTEEVFGGSGTEGDAGEAGSGSARGSESGVGQGESGSEVAPEGGSGAAEGASRAGDGESVR